MGNDIFDGVVFGAFTGVLTDYILGRFEVRDKPRIVISTAVGVVCGLLVGFSKVAYF